ncbi:MAG: hypothetical protein ACRD0P_28455 [Stackebrandtia sp.]
MGDTDHLKAKASAALAEIAAPAADEVVAAARTVTEAADGAKRRGDAMVVAASEGYYEPDNADHTWIVPYYVKFHQREPSRAATMAADLDEVRSTLLSEPVSTVSSLRQTVGRWQGAARDSFVTHILEPFPDAVRHQNEVVDELRCALWAYQAVLGRARVDAKAIADATVKVLEGLDNFKSSEATIELSVIGSAATLLAGIDGDSTLDLALRSGKPVETAAVSTSYDIDGYDVSSVLDAMKRALDALEKAMNAEESNIGGRLAESNTKVDQLLAARGGDNAAHRTALLTAESHGSATPRLTDTDPTEDAGRSGPPAS